MKLPAGAELGNNYLLSLRVPEVPAEQVLTRGGKTLQILPGTSHGLPTENILRVEGKLYYNLT